MEKFGHGLGDAADAALDGAAVFDQPAEIAPDAAEDVAGRGGFDRDYGFVKRNHRVEGIDVDEAVAERAGHAAVDLGDDAACVGGGGLDDIDGDAKAAEAVDIGRRNRDQGDIEGNAAAFKLAGDIG